MSDHDDVVQRQFGAQASAYLSSAVHAQGVAQQGEFLALAGEVVAYDLSAEMLAVVAQSAAERGMANIRTEQGKAESLPFADGEFDFVFSRYSTHHWRDVGLALREVRRVLKPGGVAIFVDV
ncbi:class I SAM-dependent methyltransferase, partial [Pseudomonas aeruginosa]|uniref:class I SAM-dependent methyltransferase n=1 Tax=Pseudomonas aeruginosa TaxID=287 RepID=UPI0024B77CA2